MDKFTDFLANCVIVCIVGIPTIFGVALWWFMAPATFWQRLVLLIPLVILSIIQTIFIVLALGGKKKS
ncbi:MAG: hypothetical protein AAB421_04610 [Patescibacteria group bacterium]